MHLCRGEAANATRRSPPHGVADVQLASSSQIEGPDRQPGDAPDPVDRRPGHVEDGLWVSCVGPGGKEEGDLRQAAASCRLRCISGRHAAGIYLALG